MRVYAWRVGPRHNFTKVVGAVMVFMAAHFLCYGSALLAALGLGGMQILPDSLQLWRMMLLVLALFWVGISLYRNITRGQSRLVRVALVIIGLLIVYSFLSQSGSYHELHSHI